MVNLVLTCSIIDLIGKLGLEHYLPEVTGVLPRNKAVSKVCHVQIVVALAEDEICVQHSECPRLDKEKWARTLGRRHFLYFGGYDDKMQDEKKQTKERGIKNMKMDK